MLIISLKFWFLYRFIMNKWFELSKIFGTITGLVFVSYGISQSFDTLLFSFGLLCLTIVYSFIGFQEEVRKEKPHKQAIELAILLLSWIALFLFLIYYPRP
jgi:hypothetical protein